MLTLPLSRRRPCLAPQEEEEDGGNVDLDSRRQGKAVVLKTTTRQTIFLPVIGLVDGGAPRDPSDPLSFFKRSRDAKTERLKTSERRGRLRTLPGSIRLHVDPDPSPIPPRARLPPDKLKPADLVGVNKDSYLILDTLPAESTAASRRWRLTRSPRGLLRHRWSGQADPGAPRGCGVADDARR